MYTQTYSAFNLFKHKQTINTVKVHIRHLNLSVFRWFHIRETTHWCGQIARPRIGHYVKLKKKQTVSVVVLNNQGFSVKRWYLLRVTSHWSWEFARFGIRNHVKLTRKQIVSADVPKMSPNTTTLFFSDSLQSLIASNFSLKKVVWYHSLPIINSCK